MIYEDINRNRLIKDIPHTIYYLESVDEKLRSEGIELTITETDHYHAPIILNYPCNEKEKVADILLLLTDGNNAADLRFITNRVDSSKITYMFLMTDGQNELEIPEFEYSLSQWGNRFRNKNVYGFYVMLHKDAKNPKVEQIIKQQEHLWKVETADVNINLIRFDDKATFNIRGDKFVECYSPFRKLPTLETRRETDFRGFPTNRTIVKPNKIGAV